MRRSYSITDVDENIPQNRRGKNTYDDASVEPELKDEPGLDAKIVSRWVAREYGESSQEYYEAYSQELLRSKQLKKKAA